MELWLEELEFQGLQAMQEPMEQVVGGFLLMEEMDILHLQPNRLLEADHFFLVGQGGSL